VNQGEIGKKKKIEKGGKGQILFMNPSKVHQLRGGRRGGLGRAPLEGGENIDGEIPAKELGKIPLEERA